MTLKTLKDIIVEQSGGARVYPMINEGKIPNTSDKIYLDAIGVIELKIREVAKEWVQALKDSLAEGLVEEHIMKRDAKIEWIACFF